MGFLGDNSAPSAYQYGGMGTADRGALNATASIPRAAYGTGYDPSATVQAGQNVMNSVQGLQPYWTQALQQGFDPQQDYYNRASGQNQQKALAMQAAQGVTGTPYGAGLSNQAQSNFDIDWQRDALNRQAQGARRLCPNRRPAGVDRALYRLVAVFLGLGAQGSLPRHFKTQQVG